MKSWVIARVDNNKYFCNIDIISERLFNRKEAEDRLMKAKIEDPESVVYLFEAVAEAKNQGVPKGLIWVDPLWE